MPLTPINSDTIATPNTPTPQSGDSIAVPRTPNAQTAIEVAVPRNVSAQTASEVAVPRNLSAQTASELATPRNVSAQTASEVAVPNTLVSQVAQTVNRALTPALNLDFANGVYGVNGVSGDLTDIVTYTRGSSATYIETYKNERGVYDTRLTTDYVGSVTNLLTYSEQFDNNSVWPETRINAEKSNDAHPDGSAVFALRDTIDNNTHIILQAYTFLASSYTFSVDLKAGTLSVVTLLIFDGTNSLRIQFNAKTGEATNLGGVASARYLSDGWWRVSINRTTAAGVGNVQIRLIDSATLNESYAGTGSGYVLASRAQLTQSDKPLPYVKTVASGVTQTFTASPRIERDGIRIENTRTNLLLQSENFEATWSKGSCTTIPNNKLAPDGSYTATKLIPNNSTALTGAFLFQSITKSAVVQSYNYSIFAKAGEMDSIRIQADSGDIANNSQCRVNLLTGEVREQASSGTFADEVVTVLKVGDYYRVILSFLTGAETSVRVQIYADDTEITQGNGNLGIYVWGAQLTSGGMYSAYTRTTTSAITKSEDNPSLRLEQQSGEFTVYVKANYNFGADFSPDQRVSLEWRDDVNDRLFFVNNAGFANAFRAQINGTLTTPLRAATDLGTSEQQKGVITYKDGVYSYYYNGQFIGSQAGNIPQNISTLYIGRTAAGNLLDGNISEIIIYHKALTADEVKAL